MEKNKTGQQQSHNKDEKPECTMEKLHRIPKFCHICRQANV